MMPMDIRDYLPPNLKHVMAYANPAERERRRQAAREAFGRPTPVPVQDAEPGDDDPTLEKVQEASPWSARETSRVDKGALPSALMPPAEAVEGARPETAPVVKPAKVPATVRVLPLRVVVLAALGGLAVGGIVIARAMLHPVPVPAVTAVAPSVRATATATAGPSMVVEPSAVLVGAVPAATAGASAEPVMAPSATATAVPNATAPVKTAPEMPKDDPYAEPSIKPDAGRAKPLRPEDY
jgi:hypothetical protein